ncbi:SDR family oxidoreductase [Desulfurivibrio sp. D14AmB]|uniref:SDR family oxidoreductase n=1 Tax=Desulfurivibrio sp. D14AmB TaxID=3374370 RepID=UPI00376EAD90
MSCRPHSHPRVLITGATGYIGRRLEERLLADGNCSVRLLVRNRSKVRPEVARRTEIIEGDTFKPAALDKALAGIDTAYYLIHSMGSGPDYDRLDRQSATNFRGAAIRQGVRRIVYLGGLGEKETASKHLLSRIETGEILSARPDQIQTIWFRAGVIIGSGSASFEIIRNLAQKLPLMLTPRWVSTRTQAIAVSDVLAYLAAARSLEQDQNLVVDIGAEPMRFRDMLTQAAAVMGLRLTMIPVPVLSPKLSSYWLVLFTPVPFRIAAALVEGLRSETLVKNDLAGRYFPQIKPLSYRRAVAGAIAEIKRDQVLSRWCDSSGGSACDIANQDDVGSAILRDRREVIFTGTPASQVFTAVTAIGGERGWFTYNFLWRLRGFLDKAIGGYGLSRGRRSGTSLRVGDALDFWKVADIKPGKRVLLLAQMRLPGKAWLEFDIREDRLVQTAHFYPQGVWGRVYWYSVLPFHHLVFRDLAKNIVKQAQGMKPDADRQPPNTPSP